MEYENMLSKGFLKTIMNNKDVKDPVIQVLGVRKITAAGAIERYRLLISDGHNLNSFAMLATQLNNMVSSGEITEFSILRIKRYVISSLYNCAKGNKGVMIFIDLDVIVPGDVVGSKISNPLPIIYVDNVLPNLNESPILTCNTLKPIQDYKNVRKAIITPVDYENMLSKGCLKSIINNKYVKDPVIQVLGVRKITAAGAIERYRLLISDGHNLNSFAMLATQLNSMVSSGEITEFSILRIKRYVISSLSDCAKGNKGVMIFIDLDIIVSGNVVGSKIGDPLPIIFVDNVLPISNENPILTCNTLEPIHDYKNVRKAIFSLVDYENMLSKGCLKSIMNNEDVKELVIQVLGVRKITAVGVNERYCLFISDGYNFNSLAMLATQLDSMVSSGEITEFSILKIKRYIISNLTDRSKGSKQIMILIDLVVIVPGDVVGCKIGDPQPIIDHTMHSS